MKLLCESGIREVIHNARKDFYPKSGTVRISRSYLDALEREVNKVVRKHVKQAGPGTKTLTGDLLPVLPTIPPVGEKGGKK